MAYYQDFYLGIGEDGTLIFNMAPPAPVSGRTIQFQITGRFGGASGLVQCYCGSGFNNVSGINVVDGANGVYAVSVSGGMTSGWDPKNYAYTSRFIDHPNTLLSEGYGIFGY